MRVFYTVLLTLAGASVIFVLVGLIFIYSGTYNVAATKPHTGLVRWVLEETMENSVGGRADEIVPPEVLPNPVEGVVAYDSMCRTCHGAPGIARDEIGQGLNPEPPDLEESVGEMEVREVFWVIKHGIKMAGMPAFGVTHPDEAIWKMTGFVEALPGMTGKQYQDLLREGKEVYGEHEEGHSHEAGDEHAEMAEPAETHHAGSPEGATEEHHEHGGTESSHEAAVSGATQE